MGGISYIPIMIGLFAMSQAFENIEDIFAEEKEQIKVTNIIPKKEDLKSLFRIAPITGLIGTMIGIIPGAGADIGAFVGYNVAQGMAKHPEEFGNGSIEGICGPEGGNNGVTGGALTIQGLTPGPMLFETNKVLVYTIFIVLIVGTLFGSQLKDFAGKLFKKKAVK